MIPIAGILAAVQLGRTAFDTIASFSGNAKAAKASAAVQDAVSIIGAVTPLVQSFANGQDVTPEQVKAALAGKDAALAEFDRLIAEKSAPGT